MRIVTVSISTRSISSPLDTLIRKPVTRCAPDEDDIKESQSSTSPNLQTVELWKRSTYSHPYSTRYQTTTLFTPLKHIRIQHISLIKFPRKQVLSLPPLFVSRKRIHVIGQARTKPFEFPHPLFFGLQIADNDVPSTQDVSIRLVSTI